MTAILGQSPVVLKIHARIGSVGGFAEAEFVFEFD